MSHQVALDLRLPTAATFDNFFAGDNQEPLAALRQCTQSLRSSFLSLWGGCGSGKTHLLLAASASSRGGRGSYLSLSQAMHGTTQDFLCQAGPGLYCLDEIDAIAGDAVWEEALHHFYNAVREKNGRLISASRLPPKELPIQLADLQSRLSWGPAFHLQELNEEGKRLVLIRAAEDRGLHLPPETANYLLHRQARDLASLLALLELLDRASLSEQRRLSIPFVRSVLA